MMGKLQQWVKAGLVTSALLGGAMFAQQTQSVSASSSVGMVNYVKGYGIAIYQQPLSWLTGKYLATNSNWKVYEARKSDQWNFNLGGKQWISGKYFDLREETSMQTLNGVVRIQPGTHYGFTVWDNPSASRKATSHALLKAGSSWRVVKRAVVQGAVWYNLGGNQWIYGDQVNLISEQYRGMKTYTSSIPEDLIKLDDVQMAAKINTRLVEIINQYRQQHGAVALRDNDTLMAAAKVRSQQEADAANAKDVYAADHNLPDGQPFYKEAHFAEYSSHASLVGENLLITNGSEIEEIAQNAFNQWKNSPGHNANMLNPKFVDQGMGVICLHNGQWLALQDFGG